MKIYGFISIIFLFFFMAKVSYAGDYHNQAVRQKSGGVTIACAQCHVMHGTQGGGSNSLIYDGTDANYAKLIRMETVTKLCKHCHDGDPASLGAPDLFSPPYAASGGDYSPNEDNRHSILATDSDNLATPPGYTGTWSDITDQYGSGLNCVFCHDQHGNTNYRNVRPNPISPKDRDPAAAGAIVSYNNGVWATPSAIAQAVIDGSGDGSDPANQYKTTNMAYRKHKNSGNVIQIAGFCGKCHIKFFGAGGDSNMGATSSGDNGTPWKRHPVGGISVGVGNGHTDPDNLASITGTNRVRVINPDGMDTGADEQPFCFTCHRAHGSSNHSNLIYGAPTSIGGAGSEIWDTCQQCHNQ